MKIIRKVASGLETGARVWAAYWLLILGSSLVCVSVLLRWVNFPLSRSYGGLQLPLDNLIGLVPHYHILSYGILVVIVLAVGLLSRSFSSAPFVLTAAILVSVFIALPCQVAFEQPVLLHRLNEELNDVSLTRSFTKQYLPQNFGYLEDLPRHLELGTTWGRFLAATSFMGLGWACLGAGSFILMIYAISRLPRGNRLLITACLCLPVGAFIILITRPLIGQHYFIRARAAQAQGRNEEAIADYKRAMWWDRWFDEDITTYAMIGDLQRQSNVAEGSPERHVKQAEVYKEAGQFEPAIFELSQAASSAGSIAVAARRDAARTRLLFGLALYRAGAVGGAITNWQQSLAENPLQIQGLLFLARGNYDLALYQPALDAANEAIKAAGLNSLLADAYSLAADCYTKLGQDADARRYYTRSIKLDNDINLWAATGLIGN